MSEKISAVNAALMLPLGKDFDNELKRLVEGEEEAVIAFMDIDCFGRINKDFDRDEGDRILIETGRFIKRSLDHATVYRYGGDEFTAIFEPGIEKEEALLKLEAMRAEYSVADKEGEKMTLSIGIAALGDDADSETELVRKASGAMFRAKTLGKDRVCLAREEKMVTKTAHYTQGQLLRLTKLSKRDGIGEAILLREALDMLLKKYGV